ncbi:MAG TPA: hypothetical protein VK894_05915 [Jiangellales bacterium]|nr:hypothetical protein [Jiangellales bacterium]
MKHARVLVGAAIAALVTSLLAVIPAEAARPVTYTEEFSDVFTDTESCEFDVEVSFAGTLRITEFYDGTGNLVRVQIKGEDHGTATANGKTASGRDNWLETFDAGTGTSTIRGLYIRFNIPGHGVVLLDVGYAEFDGDGVLVQLSGPHQAFEGDFEALCAALA